MMYVSMSVFSTVIFGSQLLDSIVVEQISWASDLIPGAYRGFLGYEKVKGCVLTSSNAVSRASELFFFLVTNCGIQIAPTMNFARGTMLSINLA
jgi:hypothetical protein